MKNYLAALFIFFSMSEIYAQKGTVNIGLEGGATLSYLYGNWALHGSFPASGITGGVTVSKGLSDNVSLNSGLMLTQKGAAFQFQATDEFGNDVGILRIKYIFNYITVPITAKYSFGNTVKFKIGAGTYLGYLWNNRLYNETDGTILGQKDQSFKKIDCGVLTTAGISAPFNEKYSFSFEVSNQVGLLNISKLQVVGNGSIKTETTSMIAGVQMKVK